MHPVVHVYLPLHCLWKTTNLSVQCIQWTHCAWKAPRKEQQQHVYQMSVSPIRGLHMLWLGHRIGIPFWEFQHTSAIKRAFSPTEEDPVLSLCIQLLQNIIVAWDQGQLIHIYQAFFTFGQNESSCPAFSLNQSLPNTVNLSILLIFIQSACVSAQWW